MEVWSKRLGLLVFAVLFLLNIKIMFSDGMSNGDISLLGIEVELFQGTSAIGPDEPGKPCNKILTYWHIFFDLSCDYNTGGNCCSDE